MRRRLLRALLILLALLIAPGLALFALFGLSRLPPLPVPPRAPLDLEHVVLVTPGAGRRGPVTLRVRDGRIAAIEDEGGAGKGDKAGKEHMGGPNGKASQDAPPPRYVLPGLMDAHVHSPILPGDEPLYATLYLLHGVTAVRNLGDGNQSLARKPEVAAGRLGGPRLFACGMHFDGPPGALVARTLRTPAEGRAAVAEQLRRGADCIKVFSQLDAATYEAMREAAHGAGVPIVGHMNSALGLERARMDDVQHLTGVPDAPSPSFGDEQFDAWWRAWDAVDEARLDAVVAAARQGGAVHTPTLVGAAYAARGPGGDLRPHRELLPAWYGALWRRLDEATPPFRRELLRRDLPRLLHATARLHRGGVPLQAGSDTFLFIPYVTPGASLHDELRLLVEAGLSPEEALAAATTVPARRLPAAAAPGLGTLVVGAPADLAIFRQDPTRSLGALDTLDGSVVDGRLYRRAELEAQLERQLAAARRLPYALAARVMLFFGSL